MYHDLNVEEPAVISPRKHELAIEILKFLTAVAGLLLLVVSSIGKYPWLSKPWVLSSLIGIAVLVLIWFAKPRLVVWLRRIQNRRRGRQFIAQNDVKLRELMDQFAVFTSDSDSRSLINILRSAYSQNTQAAEEIVAGDYIGGWLSCYFYQLTFPAESLRQFLSHCRESSHIVQSFNTNYALRAQRQLAGKAPLSEHFVAQLEQFRDEYIAFLRAFELWAKGIANYLQSSGVTDQPTLWRLAPTASFERPKSFKQNKRD